MRRRTFLLGSLAVAGLSACGGSDRGPATGGATRSYGPTTLTRTRAASDAPNVLFFSIDDCSDWVGFLDNHPGTSTPNLDALAAESLVFTKAYTAAPMCLPSRSAMMFGRAPYESGVYNHSADSKDAYERMQVSTPSIVDSFWAAGYETFGVGKIFHDPQEQRWTDSYRQPWYVPIDVRDEPNSKGRYDPDWISPYTGEPIGQGDVDGAVAMVDFGPSGKSAEDDPDGLATAWVIDHLRTDHEVPFFLGHGVYLPHRPWRVPQRFFDLHPLDEVVVPDFRPEDLDDLSLYTRENIIDPFDAFELLYDSGIWQEAVQAYQAAISYADWNVGQVLDELYSGPYADDTVIAVSSDHGYHLGEKLHLHKQTLWERATHLPMLIRAPDTLTPGDTFDRPVSLVDLGPTVLDLCGIEPLETHQGETLVPALDEPTLADDRPPVMTWLEGNHAVRSGQWRYIRYRTGDTELYDLETDPDEYTNLSALAEHADLQRDLDTFLPPPSDVGVPSGPD